METMFETIEDWEVYISQLAGKALRSKARAANSQAFVDIMLDEGHDLAFVEQIVLAFVRQLARTGGYIPEGGAFDMANMADLDPTARQGATMSPEEADEMAANPPPEPPDEVDEMVVEADEVDLADEWGDPLPVV